jgi:competence protein ComEC
MLWLRSLRAYLAVGIGLIVGLAIGRPHEVSAVESPAPFQGIVVIASVPIETNRVFSAVGEVGDIRYRLNWVRHILAPGDNVRVYGESLPLSTISRSQVNLDRVSGRIRIRELEIVSHGPPIWRFAVSWRHTFRELARSNLDRDTAATLEGLCLNMDQGLSADFRHALSRTGTIHIVSASGLHIALFAVLLHSLFGVLPIRRGIRIAVILALIGIFAAVAGFEAPVVRSVIMAALIMPAYLVRRDADPLTAVSIALIAELVIRPESLLDIGVQLSYVCTFALILFVPRWSAADSPNRFAEAAKISVRASLVAWLASVPLVAYHFGLVSLVSIPANLAIAWLVGPILAAGLGASVVNLVSPGLAGAVLRFAAGPLASSLEAIVRGMASLPFAAIEVPAFSAWWLAPIYGVLLLLWKPNETS